MKNKIGIFDSGVGGLTVLKSIYGIYPNMDYIYIGDNKNCPYGEKTKEELLGYAKRIINYFINNDVNIVIIACNTTCSNCIEELKTIYNNIKIIGVIDSTIKEFIKSNKKNVLIIGTNATIKSNIYYTKIKKINNNIIIDSLATPKIVPLIENMRDTKHIVDEYLKPYKNIDSIILGCTHYKLIEKDINSDITIINSSDCVVNEISKYCNKRNGSIEIYTTGNLENFNKLCKLIIGFNAKYLEL